MPTLITDQLITNLIAFIQGNGPSDLEEYDRYRRLKDVLFDQLPSEEVRRIKQSPYQQTQLIRQTLLAVEEASPLNRNLLRAFSSPTSVQKQRPNVDVLLVTVTKIETKAFIDELNNGEKRSPEKYFINNQTYHYLGVIGGANIFLLQSGMGTSGVEGSILSVNEAISNVSPSAIIMAGIAFGMNSRKQKIGDVLVAKQLSSYELQRVSTSSDGSMLVVPRGDRVPSSPRLLDRFRSGEIDWTGATIQFGLIFSGEKLVDNADFKKQLLQREPEAIGGEMEGAGLYAVAQRAKTDWLLIKAICDWADGNKNYQKEKRQQIAAQNVAKFVFHVLKQGGFARNNAKV